MPAPSFSFLYFLLLWESLTSGLLHGGKAIHTEHSDTHSSFYTLIFCWFISLSFTPDGKWQYFGIRICPKALSTWRHARALHSESQKFYPPKTLLSRKQEASLPSTSISSFERWKRQQFPCMEGWCEDEQKQCMVAIFHSCCYMHMFFVCLF